MITGTCCMIKIYTAGSARDTHLHGLWQNQMLERADSR
jgi:hypothetical protein